MNQLISHIEFLLHTHDCVIVPALGGFVVNSIPSAKDGLSVFNSPACELLFNRELTHNDGLLVQSYMRTENISFENAAQKIEESVREIKNMLRREKTVDLGDLGSFSMIDEQRFVYRPKPFMRPEHFGLSQAALKPIIQLQPAAKIEEKQTENKKSTFRKISIGAAAAAVIAAIMFIFPIQDNTLRHQNAQIISESGWFGNKSEKSVSDAVNAPRVHAEETVSQEVTEAAIQTPNATDANVASLNSHKYYIVTGVYQVKEYADAMLAKLQSEGFAAASVIERPNRIDVYAQSFSTRQEAEENLLQLKKDFSNHRDAWVLEK